MRNKYLSFGIWYTLYYKFGSMSKMTRLTGINTIMKHVPAEPTVSHLVFVTCIHGHCPHHGGEVLKDENLSIKFWKLHIETERGYAGKLYNEDMVAQVLDVLSGTLNGGLGWRMI